MLLRAQRPWGSPRQAIATVAATRSENATSAAGSWRVASTRKLEQAT